MPQKPFPGYTAYLRQAATEIGHPDAEAPARRIGPLSALSNLCAQATLADPENVDGILEKAAEFRDQLHAAFRAAELMLEAVSARRDSPPAADAAPAPRGAKGSKRHG